MRYVPRAAQIRTAPRCSPTRCASECSQPPGVLRYPLVRPGEHRVTTTEQQPSTFDEAKLNAFIGKAVGDWGALTSAALVVIGDKLGLYTTLGIIATDAALREGVTAGGLSRFRGRPNHRSTASSRRAANQP